MNVKLSTIVTDHGTLRAYYHRFKIINDPVCVCKMGPQTTNHVLWECEELQNKRETLKRRIIRAGGNWPLDLANKYTKWFQTFLTTINFDNL
jgi:hypothetical protein